MVSTTLKKLALNHEAYYYTNLRFTPGCIASFKNSSTAAKLSILLTNVAWFETKVLMNGPNDKQSCSGSMIGPIDQCLLDQVLSYSTFQLLKDCIKVEEGSAIATTQLRFR